MSCAFKWLEVLLYCKVLYWQQSLGRMVISLSQTTLLLLAWGQGRTDRNSLKAENEAAKWHLNMNRKLLHSIRSIHSWWKTHKLSKIESRPDYIIAAHAFVKATLRLGLRAPLVARNKKNCVVFENFVMRSLSQFWNDNQIKFSEAISCPHSLNFFDFFSTSDMQNLRYYTNFAIKT